MYHPHHLPVRQAAALRLNIQQTQPEHGQVDQEDTQTINNQDHQPRIYSNRLLPDLRVDRPIRGQA